MSQDWTELGWKEWRTTQKKKAKILGTFAREFSRKVSRVGETRRDEIRVCLVARGKYFSGNARLSGPRSDRQQHGQTTAGPTSRRLNLNAFAAGGNFTKVCYTLGRLCGRHPGASALSKKFLAQSCSCRQPFCFSSWKYARGDWLFSTRM